MVFLQLNRKVLTNAIIALSCLCQVGNAAPASAALGCEEDKLGAVAAESAVCSKIGVDVLKQGGNAADAVCIPNSQIRGHIC